LKEHRDRQTYRQTESTTTIIDSEARRGVNRQTGAGVEIGLHREPGLTLRDALIHRMSSATAAALVTAAAAAAESDGNEMELARTVT